MMGNQDKMHDLLTEFGVRVTDQSFIVMVCERKFTFCRKCFHDEIEVSALSPVVLSISP